MMSEGNQNISQAVPEPILYIDDEQENLRGFQFLFKSYYKIYLANSADEGFEILKQVPVKLILADQRMPKMTGVDFFEQVSKMYPDIIRVIITGYSDVEAIIKAINKGNVFKYVTKPWDKEDLKLIIDNALWSFNIAAENRNLIDSLKEANSKLLEANQTLEHKVKERTEEILWQKKEIEEQRDIASQQRDKIAEQNEELKKHQTQLEQLVMDRTIDLVKAKEKAEESDKLKSSFLANLSHEIRTPLNAIIGFSNIISDGQTTSEEKEKFKKIINSNCECLLGLIEDIIDFSKIESCHIDIVSTEISLQKLMMDIQAIFELQLKKQQLDSNHNLQLKVNFDENYSDIYLETDEIRIRQILSNIINNAIKFTNEGSIDIGCKINEENGFAEFYVKDTGIGIKDEYHKAIFDRFFKIEEDKNKLHRGAGIGLAISKQLVNLLGGEIWVKSELGKGTTFYFTIPLKKNSQAKKVAIKEVNNEYTVDFNNIKVLVAEDDLSNYVYLEKVLKKYKIDVVHALNGNQAISLLSETPDIQLVLMDIKMPVLDGVQALKQIREKGFKTPVVAQTAYALSHEVVKLKEEGFDDYISKPLSINDILKVLNRWINCKVDI